MRRIMRPLLIVLILVFLPLPASYAVWVTGGTAVAPYVDPRTETPVEMVSDGAGGAIMVYSDFRNGTTDLYVQRMNPDGTYGIGWPAGGILICAASGDQVEARIVSDGAGGAIITWSDYRYGYGDVYAQRVDSDGSIHAGWPVDGIGVCTDSADQLGPEIIPDGAGGAILAWYDERNGVGNYDIYAQRIDADGSVHAGWPSDGLAVCTASDEQYLARIAPDGFGGAVIAWRDRRNSNYDIYVQRIDADGSIHAGWAADGNAVCNNAAAQSGPQIVSNGAGGAIISWSDDRNGNIDIFAQHIDQDGSIHAGWSADGVAVCTSANSQTYPILVPDGAGGAFITWKDGRSFSDDIYAQRIDAGGNVHTGWTINGVAVCTAAGSQSMYEIVQDGAGGVIITWADFRDVNYDIYAQRIDADGNIHTGWTVDGEALCTLATLQFSPAIIADGAGGAIVSWTDERDGNYGIFAQHIDPDGSIHSGWAVNGDPVCVASSSQNETGIASDGAGGAFIAWLDSRRGDDDIYVQRVGPGGDVHAGWDPGGEIVCTEEISQDNFRIISDGTGGAIIAWQDRRNGNNDIFAQRIDADGSIHAGWAADGVAVCTDGNSQTSPEIVSDGAGGAIITWQDSRYDIYAQRIDADGGIHAGWAVDGEPVCTATGAQSGPSLVSDGAGGAIIIWRDTRDGLHDIYAQRIDADGSIHAGWAVDGEPVCTEQNQYFKVISDGAGGAIVTWEDTRSGGAVDIYAQRIDADGGIHPGWAVNGEPVSMAAEVQNFPRIVSDGAGGAVIIWQDSRVEGTDHIYAQRVDADGSIHAGWAADGQPVCTDYSFCYGHGLVSDGAGGAIVKWFDYRNGDYDVFIQRIDAGGVVQWTEGGDPVCTETGNQDYIEITSDGNGGAILAWRDARDGETRIYAGRKGNSGLDLLCWVDPDVIDLPDALQVGGIKDTTFTISNIGTGYFTGVVSESSDQFEIISGGGSYRLESGESLAVTVRFEPTAGGLHQCEIETGLELCGSVTITGSAHICPPDSVIYVDVGASGAGDGTSWADAFTSLQDALESAAFCPDVEQIWVAGGTYRPAESTDRSASFQLRDSLAIYGGFAGGETLLTERDWKNNITVLSGDIGTSGVMTDNSYHVVTASGTDHSAVLDGFTVTYGYADGSGSDDDGGGMYVSAGSPIVINVEFRDNYAGQGGGFYSESGGNPRLLNVIFSGNTAGVSGGGFFCSGSTVIMANNVIFDNEAKGKDGGGLYVYNGSDVSMSGVTVSGNVASRYGGGLFTGGSSSAGIVNSIFWRNTAGDGANPEVYFMDGMSLPVFSYSLISGSMPYDKWNSSFGIDGGGNMDADPEYLDGINGDLRLRAVSPAIDRGDNSDPYLFDPDLAGGPRVQNGTVDMGAYEGGFAPVEVTLATVPSGFDLGLDGEVHAAPWVFTAGTGDTIDIGAVSQYRGDTLYTFLGWSDGGDAVHQVIVPGTDVTYTATFAILADHAVIDSIVDVPGDQGGWARVCFRRSIYDDPLEATSPIARYDIHRRVDDMILVEAVLEQGEPLARDLKVTLPDGSKAMLAAPKEDGGPRYLEYEGSYYVAFDGAPAAAPPGLWEVTATVSARQQADYMSLVPTIGDSSATVPWSVYYISAHTTTPSMFFDSPPDSGYSVDNIAPGVPVGLSVAYNTGGGNELSWDPSPEPDFQYYRIYRGDSESFVPGPANLVHQTSSTGWSDPAYDGWDVHYKVTALDHAGNESGPASPATVTGDGLPGVPKEFALYQNAPNPFNPVTTIRFDLPRAGHVRLDVYNVKGERISTLIDGHMPEGRREVVWSGTDGGGRQVTSGVYFYRLVAEGFTDTKKMILLR